MIQTFNKQKIMKKKLNTLKFLAHLKGSYAFLHIRLNFEYLRKVNWNFFLILLLFLYKLKLKNK